MREACKVKLFGLQTQFWNFIFINLKDFFSTVPTAVCVMIYIFSTKELKKIIFSTSVYSKIFIAHQPVHHRETTYSLTIINYTLIIYNTFVSMTLPGDDNRILFSANLLINQTISIMRGPYPRQCLYTLITEICISMTMPGDDTRILE